MRAILYVEGGGDSKELHARCREGKRSFELLGKLDPDTLGERLPSFVRVLRVLGQEL